MRAARVPPSIAVTTKGVHYVVATVNASASFQAYQRSAETASAAASQASSPPLPPFRFTSLLPADWSALLRMCRSLTHPSASFNFSSPGDTASATAAPSPAACGSEAEGTSLRGSAVATQNHAYLHIVERVAGDFTPNNMIYHNLQKFHLLSPAQLEAAAATAVADNAASVSPPSPSCAPDAMAAFTRLVVEMQRQSPQSPHEAAAALLGGEDDDCSNSDTARATDSAEQKAVADPLHMDADAVAKSAANAEQLRSYASTVAPHDSAAPASPSSPSSSLLSSFTFFFYPYPVSAAVCIPYCSRHFCVLVNLKPIVPNHLMVVPIRCVGTVHALSEEEIADWGHVMRCTISVLEDLRRQRQATRTTSSAAAASSSSFAKSSSCHPSTGGRVESVGNYSIAVQQGALAGQTVPHLHVHVIPFDPQGKLAGEPETDEEEQRRRPPRTPDMMRAETEVLRPLFAKHAAAHTAH